ncbi:MAG: hypothetical protein LBJ96_01050 [Holosporaceae bacterium]|nr:hypothetical protein [Holosporaceae bacterium]
MAFFKILSGTPMWVFFIFAYLVFIGIRATKDRTVHIGKIFLMPGIFFAQFLIKLIITWRLDICAIFFTALIVSLFISHFFVKHEQLKVRGKYVFVGGSCETLIVVMIIFFLILIEYIDDGGHTTSQQITTFLECYDKIADDGIYLCEDLHTNYWDPYTDTDKTFIELARDHIDALTAWFFGKNKNINARRKGNYKDIPVFTGITHSITFYNSIVVFEKSKQCEPFSELR